METGTAIILVAILVIIVFSLFGYIYLARTGRLGHKITTTSITTTLFTTTSATTSLSTSTISVNTTTSTTNSTSTIINTTSATTTPTSTITGSTTSSTSTSTSTTTTIAGYNYLSMSNNENLNNVTLPASGNFMGGSKIAITANYLASSGWVFQNWTGTGTGSYTGTNQSATITLGSNVSEKANYKSFEVNGVPNTHEILNATYCNPTGPQSNITAHQLYIAYPDLSPYKQYPVVLRIHGGGWRLGNFHNITGVGEQLSNSSSFYAMVDGQFLGIGYAVVYINYRLAPNYTYPDPTIDVMCAVRYLRANAAKFDLNTTNIAAWGDRAGGYEVSMLALASQNPIFDKGPYQNDTSSVSAVADDYGPENISQVNDFGPTRNFTLLQEFNVTQLNSTSNAILYQASPINYVHSGAPPILIQQGLNDTVVNYTQSTEFYNALIANGDTSTLTLVQHAEHGFKPSPPNATIIPSLQQLSNTLVDFIVAHRNG